MNYKLEDKPVKEECFLLDSARRLRKLEFSEAPWPEIKCDLGKINFSPVSKLASSSPTLAHSWFLCLILPVLEKLVPAKLVSYT